MKFETRHPPQPLLPNYLVLQHTWQGIKADPNLG
jgi:hypothetical protein